MSYILDALRKADEARRRTSGPILDRVRAPREAPRRRWPWMVAGAVLVAANVSVLIWVIQPALSIDPLVGALLRAVWGTPAAVVDPPGAPIPAPAPGPPAAAERVRAVPSTVAAPGATAPVAPEPAAPTVPATPRVQSASGRAKSADAAKPVPPAPVVSRPEERREPPTAPPRPAPASQAPQAPPSMPLAASAPATVPTPLLTPSPPAARTEPPVATRPPGPEAGLAHDDLLSKLKLTVHVYAEQPADRLVFINGAKYVQGDRIDGKVLLEEITQDGAVVSFEGRRVVLSH